METINNINAVSDEDLVRKIVKTNDTLLFEVLYDRYATMVYNKCYGFAKDEDEAKDLTQDVFLKLFVKLASFKEKSKFSTWLYAFTYNHCVNYVTRNTAKKIEKNAVDYQDIENISFEEDDKDFLQMKVHNLKEALNLISPEEKMILLLKYQDYLSIKEIESVLGIGESAVKMRIKRAKDKLINEYKNNFE
ncbi:MULTISPECIES: RNA polymerase sigma factor [Flavobacteriaceae]|uniref:RNA polymerase sigma factor n=2 Tax=Flavobacteriaceae TaxID=49546 RepID=A0ABN1JTK9_9FLAO|nr:MULTISPECIES: sigma-70 family RNA polymerase sigma factor [Flavobacteriaceae]RYH74740.1 sigma-70 family RNA polymerase sigma factor [Flavobacteriaceae bacterium 144Ye]TBV26873.1 RNA polymerase subunit sigma-70 [Meridianimaribacter sp. CL38]TDY12558.1 RNA polymerase sigma-70 factor (ECF subfamily) [Meridianimaribacter flavus]